MTIKAGIDIVYVPKFKKALKSGGENFLRRVFLEQELSHLRGVPQAQHHLGGEIEHLAGIFAAKEAVIKALSLSVDSWLKIKVINNSKGAPSVQLRTYNLELTTSSLSISHDGNYVIAQFTAIIE